MQLALKYDAKTRYKVIKKIEELENNQTQTFKPSYMIDDPIERAETWIIEHKEKRQLESTNQMLEQRVAEYEPKVTYVDEILKSKNTVTISQVAEDYGMTGTEMNKVLHEIGIQYKTGGQWLLYSKYKGLGYTRSNTVDITHKNGGQSVKMHTKWTQKGRLFIYESLREKGILPLMDIRLNKENELVGVDE
jgi:phage antirepressor YoqD-like protein